MKRSLLPLALLSALNLGGCDDDDASTATSDAALTSADAGADVGADADVFAACEGERLALDQCYRGAAFAECGGTGEPAVYCQGVEGDCLWFSGGCPAQGYDLYSPQCERGTCRVYGGVGTMSWTPSAAVSFAVGAPTLDPPACDCRAESCAAYDRLCERSFVVTPLALEWSWPSMLSWLIAPASWEEDQVDGGLLLEIDPRHAPPIVRACAIEWSDMLFDDSPWLRCDAAGSVTFSHIPTTAAERDAVSLSFDLAFTLDDGGTFHWVGAYAPDAQGVTP